jgi:hypothetical protein
VDAGPSPVSLKAVDVVVLAFTQLLPPSLDRCSRYPDAPEVTCHATLICVDDTGVAVSPVGAVVVVVAATTVEGADPPPAFVATTR